MTEAEERSQAASSGRDRAGLLGDAGPALVESGADRSSGARDAQDASEMWGRCQAVRQDGTKVGSPGGGSLGPVQARAETGRQPAAGGKPLGPAAAQGHKHPGPWCSWRSAHRAPSEACGRGPQSGEQGMAGQQPTQSRLPGLGTSSPRCPACSSHAAPTASGASSWVSGQQAPPGCALSPAGLLLPLQGAGANSLLSLLFLPICMGCPVWGCARWSRAPAVSSMPIPCLHCPAACPFSFDLCCAWPRGACATAPRAPASGCCRA